jgi:hypothetical protein
MPPHPMRDLAKERRWRGTIAKWQASGVSMTEFCRQNDVPYRDFMNWRRIIQVRDLEPGAPTRNYSRDKKRAMRAKSTNGPPAPRVEFAEIQVVDSPSTKVRGEDAVLEIVLPDGTCLRTKPGCSLNFLSSVISALEKR